MCSCEQPGSWSLTRISDFGYLRGHATKEDINLEVSSIHNLMKKLIKKFFYATYLTHIFHFFQFVNANTRQVQDSFRITKRQNRQDRIQDVNSCIHYTNIVSILFIRRRYYVRIADKHQIPDKTLPNDVCPSVTPSAIYILDGIGLLAARIFH